MAVCKISIEITLYHTHPQISALAQD